MFTVRGSGRSRLYAKWKSSEIHWKEYWSLVRSPSPAARSIRAIPQNVAPGSAQDEKSWKRGQAPKRADTARWGGSVAFQTQPYSLGGDTTEPKGWKEPGTEPEHQTYHTGVTRRSGLVPQGGGPGLPGLTAACLLCFCVSVSVWAPCLLVPITMDVQGNLPGTDNRT